jgi:hypothetical protein
MPRVERKFLAGKVGYPTELDPYVTRVTTLGVIQK